MRILLVTVLLLSVVVSDIVCPADKAYAKITKKAAPQYAYEESFQIYSGATLLETSPPFTNGETRVMEYCLTGSENSQYSIHLLDSYKDSWGAGTWIMIQGTYGNIVLKNFMTEQIEEAIPFSLYYGILKAENWKVEYSQSATPSGWTTVEFADSTWKDVNLGNPTETTSGTQYFRKTFTGLTGMAAYEVQMNYKYGIVAYINGVEIFRDNMADGEITPATLATGAYQTAAYRGLIRPASEVSESSSVLAIEIHFSEGVEQTSIDFDAYLAIYASAIPEDKCYVYPYTTTITGPAGVYDPDRVFDFDRTSCTTASGNAIPLSLSYDFTTVRPYINGVRTWPFTSTVESPGAFVLEGSMSSNVWTNVISASKITYQPRVSSYYFGYFNTNLYKSYRVTGIVPVSGQELKVFELQPLICATSVPSSIEFDPTTFTFYAKYDNILIKPKVPEFTNCTVTPDLPSGLSLDGATCTITGKVLTAIQSTPYTMSSTINGKTYTGTFNIQINECAGSLIQIVRTYQDNAYFESYHLIDDSTQTTVHEVLYNSGQPNDEVVTEIFCLTGSKYTITVGSSTKYWRGYSQLYIRAILSGDETETIIRGHYDALLGAPTSYSFNIQYNIKSVSQWHYKMGEVPSNWYNDQTSGWTQGTMGSYPASSNQIQLYKKTFNVESNTNLAGVVISLRYKYGCVIYLNNHEVFRNGVVGELSTSSMAETVYSDVLYRQISLPIKTMAIGDAQAVEYIKQGSNTIAIALVAINANQKNSVFDCAVRIMGEDTASRTFDYTITADNNISGGYEDICNLDHNSMMQSYNCFDNYWTISFNKDRREWLSSLTLYLAQSQSDKQPKQFILKARNNNDEEWTTIKTVTGLTWSLIGQQKKLYFENNKPYNQYRLENIATGDENNCDWKLSNIDFASDSTSATIPELSYPADVEVYVNIEMGEVYSNSDYYFDFTINPALPEGIFFDPNNGMISGTATELKSATAHTITAKKFGGGSASVTINFAVALCTGGKGLITLVVKADYYPDETSWKLFKGRGTSGQVLQSVPELSARNALNYGDFCYPHDIYTIQLKDLGGDGMSPGSGYYLTVDLGEMVIETGQFPSHPNEENTISTSFTTNIPFQINFDNWKLYNSLDDVPTGWNTIDFDDASWTVKKAADLGSHAGITAYIRYDVNIPDIAEYPVLNVRVKYVGGLAVYFNGRKVARFNLEEDFTSYSEAVGPHDITLFSQFHIVFSTVGGVTGKNVIAFEIHRNSAESLILFDATGVFAINECSLVVDTFTKVEGDIQDAAPTDLFDLKPQTSGVINNSAGSKVEWVVENLEGSKFNSFGFQCTTNSDQLGFSVYGRWKTEEEYTSAIAVVNQSTRTKRRNTWEMPVGIAGYKEFKFEYDSAPDSELHIASFVMEYCKPSGTGVCPGIGDYPSVGEGQISPSVCSEGFRGYSYRECKDGVLGDIKTDKCVYKVPAKLDYGKDLFSLVKDVFVSFDAPTYANIIDRFYVQEDTPLPKGLTIDEKTGIISGTPVDLSDTQLYTIRGANPVGETLTTVSITVRQGVCAPEGLFGRTLVGETFVYNCAEQGAYVGTQKRACVLGEKDGVWEKATGYCMPIAAIVIIIVVVIIIITVVILIILRTRKTKAVGGVKGKAKTVPKKNDKKGTTKTVKV